MTVRGNEKKWEQTVTDLGLFKDKVQKDTCIPVFIETLFIVGKTWKQPKCSLRDFPGGAKAKTQCSQSCRPEFDP